MFMCPVQCEGPSVFKPAANSYFMMASHLTGWAPNPPLLFHATSDSLSGAVWLDSTVPASGVGANITFNSQSTFVFPLVLDDGTTMFIYMGDRWNFYGPGSVRACSHHPHACMSHACPSAPLLRLSSHPAGTCAAQAACVSVIPGCMHAAPLAQRCCASQ